MHRSGLAPNDVSAIYLSHLHGDHFGGLPWWLLDGQHVSRRTEPLLIAGPPGVESRFIAAAEALYPGSTKAKRRFEMRFVEYEIGTRMRIGQAHVTAREVMHPSGAPSCALRLETDGRVIAYSGDTEWVDALVPTSAERRSVHLRMLRLRQARAVSHRLAYAARKTARDHGQAPSSHAHEQPHAPASRQNREIPRSVALPKTGLVMEI